MPGVAYIWPASKHAWALNEIQRFFIEDTRLGVPITGSHYYLTDVLRTRLGFKGYVVSDSHAVEFLTLKHLKRCNFFPAALIFLKAHTLENFIGS